MANCSVCGAKDVRWAQGGVDFCAACLTAKTKAERAARPKRQKRQMMAPYGDYAAMCAFATGRFDGQGAR